MMTLEKVRARAVAAVERRVAGRVAAIERAVRAVGGIAVERQGERVTLGGRGLKRRWIEDVRLRFAGLAR